MFNIVSIVIAVLFTVIMVASAILPVVIESGK